MFSQYLITVFYSNKTFQNPVLGKLSCDVIKESFQECKKHHQFKKKQEFCNDLKYIMQQCYFSDKPEDINKLIMKEFKQAYITTSFFESRKSVLSEKLFENSWSVFYNRANLKKYQKYINRVQGQNQGQSQSQQQSNFQGMFQEMRR